MAMNGIIIGYKWKIKSPICYASQMLLAGSSVLRVSRDSDNWRTPLTIGEGGTASRHAGRSQCEVCLGKRPVSG